jgi:hypothetical protein
MWQCKKLPKFNRQDAKSAKKWEIVSSQNHLGELGVLAVHPPILVGKLAPLSSGPRWASEFQIAKSESIASSFLSAGAVAA